MKMIHCANILLGEIGDLNMSYDRLVLWQKMRVEAFELLLKTAKKENVRLVLISGGLFADNFVHEAIVEQCMQLIRSCSRIQIVLVPNESECRLLLAVDDLPDNFHMLAPGNESFRAEHLCIALPTELALPDGCYTIVVTSQSDDGGHNANQLPFSLHGRKGNWFACNGRPATQFEPVADEYRSDVVAPLEKAEFSEASSGYWIWDIKNAKTVHREWKPQSIAAYYTQMVDVTNAADFQEVCRRVVKETLQYGERDLVRVVLTGAVPVGVYINTQAIHNAIAERFLYVEVYNDCQLSIDEGIENDISLQGVFVQKVLADETLSENEKARIIRCGWNALNGKELFE